jgi:predicted membrane protein (TIGR00267 family)
LFALVIGLVDGILTALTLAAGRVVSASAPIDVSLALRISAGASLSGAFIFFTAEYARLRGDLAHAERQLMLTPRGRMAATKLGGAVFRETVTGTTISSICSFLGALLPLAMGSLIPGRSWFAIATAIFALGLLGLGLARLVYGNPFRWAVILVIAGAVLSLIGMKLHIV